MSNLILTIFCLAFSIIPEVSMYFLYQWIAPTSALAKVAVLAIFWCGGLGLCILFAYLGFAFWVMAAKGRMP